MRYLGLAVLLCLAVSVAQAQTDGGLAADGMLLAEVPEPAAEQSLDPPSPTDSAPLPAQAKIWGRVFERGSINPVANVKVTASSGQITTTDAAGNFVLEVAAGRITIALTEAGHQPLQVVENLALGQGLKVEYRIFANPKSRYESTVRGETRHEGERFTLKDQELRQLPGTLGDPFRVIGLLPGVATPVTLLPIYVIRGASPGTSGFFLDGMRVPQLFHFMVGGGVVHGRLIDRLDFYPGVYDVSFGRYSGGIIDAETRPARTDGHHAEFELRLYDVSTLVELKLPKEVRLEFSGHYGYPGFIIRAIDNRVDLQYGDYQLRLDWRGLTVEALGSYDSLNIATDLTGGGTGTGADKDTFQLQFHRIQARYRHRRGRVEFEEGVVGGIDQMSSFGGAGVRKLSVNGRFVLRSTWKYLRLSAGTDIELSRFSGENFGDGTEPQAPDQFGELAGNRSGVVAGAYASATANLWHNRLELTGGVRFDLYHASSITVLGLDPRLQFRLELLPWLHVKGGVGYYQQPPSFPVPLPGIDTFALQLGLQHATQSAMGVEAKLPSDLTFSITGYFQKYANVNDSALDIVPTVCTSPPPESLTGIPAAITRQVDGQSFGMELLLRRHRGRFTGWVAYTLSRSERIYSCGLRPSDYDQTHLLNLVLQVKLPWKLLLGSRLYVATGRPVTMLESVDTRSTPRNNSRLPDFVQWDLRVDREWIFREWALSAFIEVVNLTYSQSVFGLRYPLVSGVRRYDLPQLNGFSWILPSLGVRGYF